MKNPDPESLEWRDNKQDALENDIVIATRYSRLSKFSAFLLSTTSGMYLSTSIHKAGEHSGVTSDPKIFIALGIAYAGLAISSYFTSEYFNAQKQSIEHQLVEYEAKTPLIPSSVIGNANATNTAI